MKKKTSALLALLLCFAMLFTACGKEKEETEKHDLNDKVQVEEQEEKEEKEEHGKKEDGRAERPTKPSSLPEREEQPKPAENTGLKPNPHSGSEISDEDWTLYYTLKICFYSNYGYYGSELWYGEYDDYDRIAAATNILVIWQMMGYDIADWTGNDLAQEMNNYYDQDTSLSIWDTACAIVGLDHSELADFYLDMMYADSENMYYWPDVDGDIWYWDGEYDTYIGSGDQYYIADDGECYEYEDPFFWYDDDGDIWYGIGDGDDEFIGFGDEYYIGDDGEIYTYSDVEDYGSDPFFWSDAEGVVWYWNGESDEFIGTSEEYYVGEDGNIYKTTPPVENKGPSKFYWEDEDDDVWFWNGQDNEFIGWSNECYVDEAGLHWYGNSSWSDPGDYGNAYIWYDEDGDMWYWNGEYNEYWG